MMAPQNIAMNLVECRVIPCFNISSTLLPILKLEKFLATRYSGRYLFVRHRSERLQTESAMSHATMSPKKVRNEKEDKILMITDN
jgi:hypothetical protein